MKRPATSRGTRRAAKSVDPSARSGGVEATAIADASSADSADLRLDVRRNEPPRRGGRYVLYWMTMFRRPDWNFALDRAVHWARELRQPLVILEPLRCGYPWASDRIHTFMLQGMQDHARTFANVPVTYYPYVEPRPGDGKGLLAALAARASVVVGDDYPAFFVPRMLEAAARRLDCRFETVDSNGLLPLRAATKAFARAVDFRRFLQRTLPPWLERLPQPDPLVDVPEGATLPRDVRSRWPAATGDFTALVPTLPIDHGVPPARMTGGTSAGRARIDEFLRRRLERYPEDRNEPELDGTSALSPYLHLGHVSVHEIWSRLVTRERWTPARLGRSANGSREGWWGTSAPAESFLDELVTWREIGFNLCSQRPDYDRYESLPAWARATLEKHAKDPRPHRYTLAQLEAGATHDPLWNAAHRQLVRDGWFHNQMRMLWAKKILEWSRRPQEALGAMAHLMNKYSVDGRGPTAYSGYFWALGRYDRPWGPERPIFGTVRYMSSDSMARKVRVKDYLRRYAV